MRNFDWCAYTWRHRKVMVWLTERLIKDPELRQRMLDRIQDHDMDKMLLYLFYDQTECQMYHVYTQPHHLEYRGEVTWEDRMETVLDLESAPYTKPDKPLNACDFTEKLLELAYITKETADQLHDIMEEWGINRSADMTQDTEGMRFAEQLGEVTEEMILLEVMEYLVRHPEALETVKNWSAGTLPGQMKTAE